MNFVWLLGLLFAFVVLIQSGLTVTIINPKLDFIETKKDSSTTVLKSPTIQGLRIIVDTTKIKGSAESKSNEDGVSREKKTKGIGVRTDITFELDNERNDSQSTSDEKLHEKDSGYDDENASVPIFKGVTSSPKDRSGSDFNDDDAQRRGDNENENRWNYHYGQRRKEPAPVFHSTDDENFRRGVDSFPNFIPPAGLWTTEQSYLNRNDGGIRNYENRGIVKPQQSYMGGHRWKPCYCDESKNFHPSTTKRTYISRQNYGIDDKLDPPFKND